MSNKEVSKTIEEYSKLLEQEKERHAKTQIKLKMKEHELHEITTSNSYRLAKVLAKSKHFARLMKNHVADLSPDRLRAKVGNKRHVKQAYASTNFTADFAVNPTSKTAVIIHLYYTDLLPYFIKKLENISHINYDLFITVPETKAGVIKDIREQLPDARVMMTPNCGRDVLPFVEVMRRIEKMGYVQVLKLHSKKSPHRIDGDVWRDGIVESLLPKNKEVTNGIIKQLSYKDTAVIGPVGEYVSLLVNFSPTSHHIKKVTKLVLGIEVTDYVVRSSDEFGFFAGTMFWARVDALSEVINSVKIDDFEAETGQVDSTFAHGLERLLSVIPELEGKNIFEVSPSGVKQINYHTTNLPKWFDFGLETNL
ncbi:MAG: rhamnan synthesis family protein [Candidatus Saccharibacteria bacterium]|nr:rhamnan synthesis family protein [Candidatus Saccharibacteria bacterium]